MPIRLRIDEISMILEFAWIVIRHINTHIIKTLRLHGVEHAVWEHAAIAISYIKRSARSSATTGQEYYDEQLNVQERVQKRTKCPSYYWDNVGYEVPRSIVTLRSSPPRLVMEECWYGLVLWNVMSWWGKGNFKVILYGLIGEDFKYAFNNLILEYIVRSL